MLILIFIVLHFSLITAGIFPNGVNLQPSYYNNGNVSFGWNLMKNSQKIKSVRIEIETSKVSIAQAKSWIDQAKSNGYHVIATYHDYTKLGSNNVVDLMTAAYWWDMYYQKLGGEFTINLMNEWGNHQITANDYASAYNSAIRVVRSAYSGPIIIDIPGWGQEPKIAADAVKGTYGTKITDTNIILSTHIYPGAHSQSTNRWLSTADLDIMGSAGVPCLVGEFGNSTSGQADWSGLVDYAKNVKEWTVMAWAWNGDGETDNMVEPSWVDNPTATAFKLSPYYNLVYPKL